MTSQAVQLVEVCDVVMGQSPPSSTYNDSGDGLPFFQGKVDFGDRYPRTRVFCSKPVRIAEQGDILISVRAPVGPTNLVREKCCIGRGLAALRPRKRLRNDYLLYFLRHREPQLAYLGQGSTFGAINREVLEELNIPLPPEHEQHRIADKLEWVDRLRRTRRYAVELSDIFLPAAFLELFGDLRQNHHHWPFVELETHAEIVSGVAKGQKYGDRETVEVPYLRVANVQDGYLDLSEIKIIRALPADVESLRLKAGDVVMTEGGDFDKLGRGAIWPGSIVNCIHQNHIFRVRLDKAILLPTFFAAFLRSAVSKDYFLRCSKQTTNLASINMTQLRATPVPLPPLVRQQHFSKLVTRHEHSRANQREALRQTDHLFQTVLHQAFDLNR